MRTATGRGSVKVQEAMRADTARPQASPNRHRYIKQPVGWLPPGRFRGTSVGPLVSEGIAAAPEISGAGQKAVVRICNKVRLQKFDFLVGADERGGWDAEGERLRPQLDDQLEMGELFYEKVGRPGVVEDFGDVTWQCMA
jgi:hypothetical protein